MGNATPGSISTRIWITSRPGTLRSCRCSSVRFTPGCCADASCRARAVPTASIDKAMIRVIVSASPADSTHRLPLGTSYFLHDREHAEACTPGALIMPTHKRKKKSKKRSKKSPAGRPGGGGGGGRPGGGGGSRPG